MADAKKPRVWLTIEKLDGKWQVLEMADGSKPKVVESAYYRDLAEDAAGKRLRRLGR